MKKMPHRIVLKLIETDTFYILDLPSKVVDKGTPEGIEADAENTRYAFLTLGKGRNRKTIDQAVQTISNIIITRKIQKNYRSSKDGHAFAATWDMYDTYNGITNDYLNKIIVDKEENSRLSEKRLCEKKSDEVDRKEMAALMHNQKFLESVTIVERLLANNNFNEQQKCFRGLLDPDPLRDNIEFKYKLNLLWTFANAKTNGKCVTCFKWNSANKDVLAVGYGKFYFSEITNGMVMIWNIKNPIQPERCYKFEIPVTSIDFSKQNPHLLAVGLYTGHIKIIDISSRYLNIIAQTTRETSPCFEAIWQIDFEKSEQIACEDIISVCKDGRICKIGPVGSNPMTTTQIMRICKTEGSIKGIKTIRKFTDPNVRVSRFQPALKKVNHPNDEGVYFIATMEGSIHTLSKYSFHRELDAFSAHDGPIYQLKFSPFCNKLLMSCGDDWNIRFWIEGLYEPILEIKDKPQSIQDADWSPTHSTIIASISGKDIIIWDIQRKVFSYQSCTRSPTNSRNTLIEFTEDGRCVVVGDVNGNVHVFNLEDMPFPPFFQADYLARSLERALITKSTNIKKIINSRKLNYDTK